MEASVYENILFQVAAVYLLDEKNVSIVIALKLPPFFIATCLVLTEQGASSNV
jgi:hypothetical protein